MLTVWDELCPVCKNVLVNSLNHKFEYGYCINCKEDVLKYIYFNEGVGVNLCNNSMTIGDDTFYNIEDLQLLLSEIEKAKVELGWL